MTIESTDLKLPGQVKKYTGKVRDVYILDDGRAVLVATDRLSAFDVVLSQQIPYKGQVLNQLSAYFLQATNDLVPNWLTTVPDPNVSIGKNAKPFPIEVVVRGVLTGSAWRKYQSGDRNICGNILPDGMSEYQAFDQPKITPTTKAMAGHDEDTTAQQIVDSGVATKQQWQQIVDYTQVLFARGQAMAAERGLVLADTKYEFGQYEDGTIIIIDEIHTPDSSRYLYKKSYDNYLAGKQTSEPQQLSKEFVRKWLMEQGFSGQDGVKPPIFTEEFIKEISTKYIELYELLTGEVFSPDTAPDPLKRIETNLISYIKENS
jgi:phosphoribosylaminoimidazole-succinocarboxamide synthase